ncbi:hypothetical protein [Rhodococcus jostii]|uniref:hypothetical protein n=1 Tax=Rhodococcus jostii TaxID=132919 RepID=UPI00362FEF2F
MDVWSFFEAAKALSMISVAVRPGNPSAQELSAKPGKDEPDDGEAPTQGFGAPRRLS